MTAEAASGELDLVKPTPLPGATQLKIFAYIGVIIVLLGFGAPGGGLIGVPITFFLKNRLHLPAHAVAEFGLIASIPLYFGVVFGFIRDTFNPLGMRDRGFIFLFRGAAAALYAVFAFLPISFVSLLIVVLLGHTAFLFIGSAQAGLSSAIGQQHAMSGRISAAWNIFGSLPALASLTPWGILSQALEGEHAERAARILFLIGAAIMAVMAVYGLWRPASVYDNLHIERTVKDRRIDDFKRLVSHWPIYPALFIWLLWNFAPGGTTPLQYYLQNTLHANDAQVGLWFAIFSAGFIPTFAVYGLLCRRYSLRTLLFWSTVVAVPQFVALVFVHSVTGSMIAAAIMGLLGGANSAAYIDLLIRSCPPGLQGAVMGLSTGVYFVVSRFGDVLGTDLYDHFHNFNVCVISITVVYALIIPALWLVPRHLTATADGELASA